MGGDAAKERRRLKRLQDAKLKKGASEDPRDGEDEKISKELNLSDTNKVVQGDDTRASSSSPSSSSDSNSDSDSDDDVADAAQQNSRSRGRRRRGRQEADAKREEDNAKVKEESKKKVDADTQDPLSKKTPRSEDKRRCIGRKPLTDFQIGKKYTGTVKYVKPTLGVFIDIGCHSDAFCHISRVADDFVDSITDDIYKAGDVLEKKVRVVEIDRRKKRITASLQSDAKITDEEKSLQARKERKQERTNKRRKTDNNRFSGGMSSSWTNFNNRDENDDRREEHASTTEPEQKPQEEVPIIIDPDNMTPAELKRARKLQRRAERRKMQEVTGLSA